MKKTIFIIGFVVVLICTFIVGAEGRNSHSSLLLENIEALAQTHGEYDGQLTRGYVEDSKTIWMYNPLTNSYLPTTVSCCRSNGSSYSACARAYLGDC